MTKNAEGLLPCPFCGEEPNYDLVPDERFMVECLNTNCVGPATSWRTPKDAIAAWNRRAADPTMVIKALIVFGGHLHYCSSLRGYSCDCGRDQAVADAQKFLADALSGVLRRSRQSTSVDPAQGEESGS